MVGQNTEFQDDNDVESFFGSMVRGMLLSIVILVVVTGVVAYLLQPIILANISIGGLSWLVSWIVAIIAGWIVSFIINSTINIIRFKNNFPHL